MIYHLQNRLASIVKSLEDLPRSCGDVTSSSFLPTSFLRFTKSAKRDDEEIRASMVQFNLQMKTPSSIPRFQNIFLGNHMDTNRETWFNHAGGEDGDQHSAEYWRLHLVLEIPACNDQFIADTELQMNFANLTIC
jgi:hypothetical protein